MVCLYEAYSIVTARTPTISRKVWDHPWLGPVVIAALALHFYWPPFQLRGDIKIAPK